MTQEEKHKACLTELLAGMHVICGADTLEEAKTFAQVAIATVSTISKEGRVPSEEESIA
jgi:hypothetical protein